MEILTGSKSREGLANLPVRDAIAKMVGEAEEKRNRPSPLVQYQSGKVVDLLAEVKKKGATNDKRRYERIREAFDQNYAKLHPFKPSA